MFAHGWVIGYGEDSCVTGEVVGRMVTDRLALLFQKDDSIALPSEQRNPVYPVGFATIGMKLLTVANLNRLAEKTSDRRLQIVFISRWPMSTSPGRNGSPLMVGPALIRRNLQVYTPTIRIEPHSGFYQVLSRRSPRPSSPACRMRRQLPAVNYTI